MQQKKLEKTNMCMSQFFESSHVQLAQYQDHLKVVRDQGEEDVDDHKHELHKEYGDDIGREAKIECEFKKRTQVDQKLEFKSICRSIYRSSRKFDLDSTQKHSPFDILVSANVLQKSLETDGLIFVEG